MRFVLALQLLTRLPIKKQYPATGADYAGSVVWFFVPALMVGIVMCAVFWSVMLLTGVLYFSALLSVIAACIFTGGFHVDGFADMCDAFFARKSPERTLKILKDSRMGTYGVLAIVFIIASKLFLIAVLWPGKLVYIIFMPVCGKIAMTACAMLSTYPREDGLGKYIIDELPFHTAVISILICSSLILVFCGIFYGLITVTAMLLVGWIMAMISKRKIGGATGDILGASNEIGEILFVCIMVALS